VELTLPRTSAVKKIDSHRSRHIRTAEVKFQAFSLTSVVVLIILWQCRAGEWCCLSRRTDNEHIAVTVLNCYFT